MSRPSAMERLADKLAAANLDDEEMALLVSLLAGSDEGDDDVAGFAFDADDPILVVDKTSSTSWHAVLDRSSKGSLFEGCYRFE